jgi:iron complex transport system substrate-binding protein
MKPTTQLVSALIAVALLAACGAPGSKADPSPGNEPQTRTIEHVEGTTQVPTDPQRIVTLQDQNALLPLLELGVTPVASAGLLEPDGSHTFRRTQGYDTSGIEFIGAYGETNLEAVAAQRPDLIVTDEYSAEDLYDELSQIAPTVVVQVFDRPLTDALEDFAAIVGEEEQAAELRTAYEARIEEFRTALGPDLERASVSLLSAGNPGTFYQSDTGGQAQYTVMRDLGLLRPAPQRGSGSDEEYSLEQLSSHDADAVILNDFGGVEGDPGVATITGSRLWANLAATRAKQAVVIDATASVGSAWGKMDTFLDQLEAVLLEPAFDPNVVREAP